MQSKSGKILLSRIGAYGPLFICILVFPLWSGFIPLAQFTEETIRLHVYARHIELDGIYIYRNPHPYPIMQGFSIPLPIDEAHPEPVEITASRLDPEKRPLSLQYLWGRHRFHLIFRPYEEIRVRVRYHQEAPDQSGRYLLTTTKPWRRGLDVGKYCIVPHGVRIYDSNYSCEPTENGTLMFARQQFMPDKDWIFWWEGQ